VRFEVFTEVTKKNAVFLAVKQCGSYKNRSCRATYRLHHRGDKNKWTRKTLVVTGLPILVTLMKNAISSSETSVLTRATSRHFPEACILHFIVSFWRSDINKMPLVKCMLNTQGNKSGQVSTLELFMHFYRFMGHGCHIYSWTLREMTFPFRQNSKKNIKNKRRVTRTKIV
jgi:hypothetical protein